MPYPSLYIYEKRPVLLKANHLLSRWPKQCGRRRLKESLKLSAGANLDNVDVACVSLMGIPIDDGRLITSKKVHVMCVYTGYTIYKDVRRASECGNSGRERWKVADCDTYDIMGEVQSGSQRFNEIDATPVTFLNASDAHAVVVDSYLKKRDGDDDVSTFYNNSHEHIDEFVYHTLTMQCVGSRCGGTGTSILLFDGKPLCSSCFPGQKEREAAGIPIEPPQRLLLDELVDCPEPLQERVYCREKIVCEEYVTFMHPSTLPFVRGDMTGDAAFNKMFMSSCLSLVYDIETINVTREKRKIPDRIVTITVGVCKGQRLVRLLLLSIGKPDGWEYTTADTPPMPTSRLLRGLCKMTTLPDVSLLKCANESEIIDAFEEVFLNVNAHFLVGYNSENFDTPFVIRASVADELEGKVKNVKRKSIKYDRFFHNRVNVFTEHVNTMTTEPFRDPFDFQRPSGKHCKGLLKKDAMDVSYNTLTSVTSIDLMPLHNNNSLAVACANMGVEEGKMEGVSHTDIPVLYYAGDERFWQYALMDVVATALLYFKSWFQAIGLYKELEKLNRTPPAVSLSRQKTCVAKTTSYVQFMSTGFLKPAELRPKRVLGEAVTFELSHYFCSTGHQSTLPETDQLITDFCNGNCKCNTTYKSLPSLDGELTRDRLTAIIEKQLEIKSEKKDRRDRQYTTADALMLIHYVTRRRLNLRSFESMLCRFKPTGRKDADASKAVFVRFLEYLCNVRRCMSGRTEDPAGVWKEYKNNYNVDTGDMTDHMSFWMDNHAEIIDVVRRNNSDELLTPRHDEDNQRQRREQTLIYDTMMNIFNEKKLTIVIGLFPFNGAINMFKGAIIDVKNITSVGDYQSLYPNVILKSNMGLDTWVSSTTVVECVRQYMIIKDIKDFGVAAREFTDLFLNYSMTRRCDDDTHWVEHVDDSEYLKRNCVFFIRTVTSVQNFQYRRSKDNRVKHKNLSGDRSLPEDVRESYKAISLAEKEILNSYYGTIASTIHVKLQATVTAGGRRELLVAEKELTDRGYRIVNGDTDSLMYVNDDFDVMKMATMSAEDMYALLKAVDYGMPIEVFREAHAQNYPIEDLTDIKSIKLAAGRVIHQVDGFLCASISPDSMTFENEKTFAGYIAPCPKKYTAINCITGKPDTKGLSSNNKTAIPLTKDSLTILRELTVSSLSVTKVLALLYVQIGEGVVLPINRDEMPCARFAKPVTINISKVSNPSKLDSLLKSLIRDGVTILYEKLKTTQVPILPQEPDEFWSLCDINNQSCAGRVHKMKVKHQVLTELITILGSCNPAAACSPFEELIWGEYHPDVYTLSYFHNVLTQPPANPFTPMRFETMYKKYGGYATASSSKQRRGGGKCRKRNASDANVGEQSTQTKKKRVRASKQPPPGTQSILSFFKKIQPN